MLFGLFTRLRRQRLKKRPLPEAWEKLVERRLPFSRHLEGEERTRFLEHLRIFFHEKRFEGVGLEVTEEMKVLVSAVAARLSRNVGFEVYDDLGSVVFYPSTVSVPRRGAGPSGVDEGRGDLGALGVAHPWGTVVLAWDAVERGLDNPEDGHDTALHELAHIIDMADGAADGTPELGSVSCYRLWTEVFSEHFEQLRKRPRSSVLRPYGATNEAEFFAVAAEAFFEKPRRLRREHPELYAALERYFQVRPLDTRGRR